MTPVLQPAGRRHRISYAVSGPRASRTRDLVLVHGWCCDRSNLAPLQERLARTHRVVAMDLRGHGQSRTFDDDGSVGTAVSRADDGPEPESGEVATSIEEFAADVVAVCEDADLEHPVVVGHSLGGLVALATLTPAGTRGIPPRWHPAGAVLLDPAPIATEKAKAYWARQVEPVARDHTGDLRRAFARSLVLETDRADYTPVVETMAAAHPQVAAGGARAMADFDGVGALAALAAPALVIQAAKAERDLDLLVPERSLLTLGRTVGAGHFHHLEVPEQLEPMIERWLEVTFGTEPAPED